MIVRIFTSDRDNENVQTIQSLFEEGLEVLHLRKKKWPVETYRQFLASIPDHLHSRIIVHDHPELLDEFRVGGIHLSEYTFNQLSQEERSMLKNRSLAWGVSTSAHHYDEINPLLDQVDHVVVGPLFTSISKPNYGPTHDWDVNDHAKREQLIAIGGIRDNHVSKVSKAGFSQMGILGYIWTGDNPLSQYKKICSRVKDLSS